MEEGGNFHDFTTDRRTMLVLGGFIPPSGSCSKDYILSTVMLTINYVTNVFLMAMAIVTFTVVKDIDTIIEAGLAFIYYILAFTIPSVRLIIKDDLNLAVKMIREGIFVYSVSVPDSVEYDMKKSRIDQVRLLTTFCIRLTSATVACHLGVMPLLTLLVGKDSPNDAISPYLPAPIYMPFDTRTARGYALAYLLFALHYTTFYITTSCFAQTYLSCNLQLVAEQEILLYSIQIIEKRAITMYKMVKNVNIEGKQQADLYKLKDFRYCIYCCLRENFIHHQRILKYKKCVTNYLEVMNFFGYFFMSGLLAAAAVCFFKNPGFHVVFILSCTFAIIAYFLMNYLGENITNKSKEFQDGLFYTPWYLCNEDFRVLISIGINRAKKPILFYVSFFNLPVSLETFGNVISGAYKIMNVLWA